MIIYGIAVKISFMNGFQGKSVNSKWEVFLQGLIQNRCKTATIPTYASYPQGM